MLTAGNDDMTDSQDSTPPAESMARFAKPAILLALCLAVGIGYLKYGHLLSLEQLASRETQLRGYQESYPWLVIGGAFVLYVSVTGLSLPGAAALSLVYGWYFGFLRGVLLVSFASTLGATLAFLLSRYLFRAAIQAKFGERLDTFNEKLAEEGPFYLFTLRLIPAVPFFVINLVMGLTPIRTRTFWWVSQLGMLPGTAVYLYAGSSVPSLRQLAEQGAGGIISPQLLLAFVLLGVFPILVKKLLARFRVKPTAAGNG